MTNKTWRRWVVKGGLHFYDRPGGPPGNQICIHCDGPVPGINEQVDVIEFAAYQEIEEKFNEARAAVAATLDSLKKEMIPGLTDTEYNLRPEIQALQTLVCVTVGDVERLEHELETSEMNKGIFEKEIERLKCSFCKDTGYHLCPDVAEPVLIKCTKKGCRSREILDLNERLALRERQLIVAKEALTLIYKERKSFGACPSIAKKALAEIENMEKEK